MSELKPRITEKGMDYIPDLKLPEKTVTSESMDECTGNI